MGKIFVDKRGDVFKFVSEKDPPVHVRFPVKLAVRVENEVSEFFYYSEFVLNISKGEVFIETDSPLSKDSVLTMHFYIPPEEKLLGEFEGKVRDTNGNNNNYPQGMFVKFTGDFKEDIIGFVDYLDEKKYLVDVEV